MDKVQANTQTPNPHIPYIGIFANSFSVQKIITIINRKFSDITDFHCLRCNRNVIPLSFDKLTENKQFTTNPPKLLEVAEEFIKGMLQYSKCHEVVQHKPSIQALSTTKLVRVKFTELCTYLQRFITVCFSIGYNEQQNILYPRASKIRDQRKRERIIDRPGTACLWLNILSTRIFNNQ